MADAFPCDGLTDVRVFVPHVGKPSSSTHDGGPDMQIDNRRDILLLLLYSPGVKEAPNEPISGRTRLTKALFLFKSEALRYFRKGTSITDTNFYEFFPWNFGPFSRQVYDDISFFQLRGFIEAESTEEETLPESAAEWEEWLRSPYDAEAGDRAFSDYEEQSFRLTDKGVQFAKKLYSLLSSEQKTLLREFKARIVRTSLRALLRYVYEKHPNQIVNSEIRDQVLGKDD